MTAQPAEVRVEVAGRQLRISNLGKVMYPETGTTKGEVLAYYAQVAPVLLPPGMGDRAVRLAGLAARCRTVVELALEDDGGSVTAAEADARTETLRPLDRAARRGLVAACAYPFER